MATSHRSPQDQEAPSGPRERTTDDVAVSAATDLRELAERVRRRVDPDDVPAPLFAPAACAAEARRR